MISAAMSSIASIADPGDAIAYTARELLRLASGAKTDPYVRSWALSAVRDCRPMDRGCEIGALLAALRRDVRYTSDPIGVDTVQSPRFTLESGGGDCDDLSALYVGAGRAIGWRVGILLGSASRVDLPTHVLPAVWHMGAWFPVEVSSRTALPGRLAPGWRLMGVME